MDNKAIRPDFFQNLPTLVKEKQAKERGLTGQEQALYALSMHEGWVILHEYAENLISDLESVTDIAMSKGMTFDEIGRNAIVANLAKGVITRILQKVDDARDAVEQNNGSDK